MKNTVLLVVDVQNALIAKQPYRGQELLENIGVDRRLPGEWHRSCLCPP